MKEDFNNIRFKTVKKGFPYEKFQRISQILFIRSTSVQSYKFCHHCFPYGFNPGFGSQFA